MELQAVKLSRPWRTATAYVVFPRPSGKKASLSVNKFSHPVLAQNKSRKVTLRPLVRGMKIAVQTVMQVLPKPLRRVSGPNKFGYMRETDRSDLDEMRALFCALRLGSVSED